MLEFTQVKACRTAMPQHILASRHLEKPDLPPEYGKLPKTFGVYVPTPLTTGL